MSELAMNIDDFHIGQSIKDKDNSVCIVTDKTMNTIEVFMRKTNKKGIDCKQWFDMKQFNKRFSVLMVKH